MSRLIALFKVYSQNLLKVLRLNTELENASNIHEAVAESIPFRGTNLWILMFASVVASLGLNINSTAVVIGAMLISPLMGPINGMGYAFATYDFRMLRRAALNFGFAAFLSVVASALYFLVSPVSQAHSELLARTTPTIFDLLIAFFGGLAGMIATCSRKKGNVLPGVAIATALMPPLCTVGFGLATFQWEFFGGALYLFMINSMFIALAAMIVTYTLKMPMRGFVSNLQKKQAKIYIIIALTLTFIPSIYYGYKLVKKEKFTATVGLFVQEVSFVDEYYLLKHAVDDKEYKVDLVFAGLSMSKSSKEKIYKVAKRFGFSRDEINIVQGIQLKNYDSEFKKLESINFEVNDLAAIIDRQNRLLDSLQYGKVYWQKGILDSIGKNYAQLSEINLLENDVIKKDTVFKIFTVQLYFDQLPSEAGKDSIYQMVKQRIYRDSCRVKYLKT